MVVALDRASPEMRDLVTYMAFLSRGVPVGARVEGEGTPALEPLTGDTVRAAALFAATCAPCHGGDGSGTNAAPALWGPKSFNIAAAMARPRVAAAFIKSAMPQHATRHAHGTAGVRSGGVHHVPIQAGFPEQVARLAEWWRPAGRAVSPPVLEKERLGGQHLRRDGKHELRPPAIHLA